MDRQNSKLKLYQQSRQASLKPPSNALWTWDLTVLIQRGVNKATIHSCPAQLCPQALPRNQGDKGLSAPLKATNNQLTPQGTGLGH